MSSREKGPDEIFCRSCGEPIKIEAEICPECGVRNKEGRSNSSNKAVQEFPHDPTQYETTVGDSWWYGVTAGVVLWIGLFIAVASIEPTGSIEIALGFITIAAWAIMPIAIYFDAKYVRANSRWNPDTTIYVIGAVIWLINIVAGIVYLYRRHETLGQP